MQSDIGNHNCSRCRTRGAKVRHREKPIVRFVRIVFPQRCGEFECEIRILWGSVIFWKIEVQGIERSAPFCVHFAAQNIYQCPAKAAFGQMVNFCTQIGHLGVGDRSRWNASACIYRFMHSPSDVCHFSEIG